MNKILITGVAGFLGAGLANRLLQDENNIVYGIDNLSVSKMTHLYPLLRNERFTFIEQDLKDSISIHADYVYHLAGNGDNRFYFEDKYSHTFELIDITKNILEYAKTSGSKIVIASSFVDFQEYNKKQHIKFDLIKLLEDLILEYSSKNHIDCKIARIANGYGKYMSDIDCRFIPKVIMSAYNNEKIILEHDKSGFYTYSNDIICALELIMNKFCNSDIIDISVHNLHLKSDIAKLIINFTKSKSQLILKNNEVYHPNYKPNIQILNEELNFRCSTPILEGISKTIDYFRLMYFS